MPSLDSHIRSTNETNGSFAARVGVSEATISRIRNGKQDASPKLVRLIFRETEGVVTPNDLFGLPPSSAPAEASP